MGRKIFTTRDIDVRFDDRTKKLKQVTTKDIEVKHLGQDEPLVPASGPLITTHNVEDFQKKAEKSVEKKPWNKMNAEEREEHQRMKAEKKAKDEKAEDEKKPESTEKAKTDLGQQPSEKFPEGEGEPKKKEEEVIKK